MKNQSHRSLVVEIVEGHIELLLVHLLFLRLDAVVDGGDLQSIADEGVQPEE